MMMMIFFFFSQELTSHTSAEAQEFHKNIIAVWDVENWDINKEGW